MTGALRVNNVDSDQTLQNMVSNQGLHCLPLTVLASVAQLDLVRLLIRKFDPPPGQQYSFLRFDQEVFSMVHSLPDSRRAVVSFRGKNVHNTG